MSNQSDIDDMDFESECYCDPANGVEMCNQCIIASLHQRVADLEAGTALAKLRAELGDAHRRVAELERDRARLLSAVGDAQHALESMRIWGGMDWHWHQPNARRAHTILSDAMVEK